MTNKFGRVDSENNVYVFELGSERRVGQYPNVPQDEALAFFTRKFDDLEAQVRILEQRVANNVNAGNLSKQIEKLRADLVEPNAVGDLNSLRTRIEALAPKVSQIAAAKAEANKEASAAALSVRVEIATAAEVIANQDPAKTQWKQSAAQMTDLFTQWQNAQKNGPRVNKSEADPIWKRFSIARSRFETAKRQYFAGLDANNKAVKATKNALVAQAEALAASGSDRLDEYRKLLDQWKAAGRTPGKSDDALWAKFKAAGDTIYAARKKTAAVQDSEQSQNLAVKLELLKQYQDIDPKNGLAEAKARLLELQKKWEKAGRIPKDKIREIEAKLKAIEAKVREAEQDAWRKTDPAAIERNNSMIAQLEAGIAKLERELEAAKSAGNQKLVTSVTEALDARKAWLATVKASAN